MSDMSIGQIRTFAGSPPQNWAWCDGRLLSTEIYTSLFSVLGYTYGGSGDTFALPDLRSRVALGFGQGKNLSSITLGEQGGTQATDMKAVHLPPHRHGIACSNQPGDSDTPGGAIPAAETIPGISVWSDQPPNATMAEFAVEPAGKGFAFENRKPFLGLNFAMQLLP